MPLRIARAILVTSLAVLPACDVATSEPFARVTLEDGFEVSLLPWDPDGTDLGDPPVVWSIVRSNDRATEGSWSARLRLENLNDQGKIWIERGLANLGPLQDYRVEISFMFATADFGTINLWRILAGTAPQNPETAADLPVQDDTGNGSNTDVGFRWIEKRYTVDGRTGADGTLWFVIGVWGTSEFTRTYYVDQIRIVATRQ